MGYNFFTKLETLETKMTAVVTSASCTYYGKIGHNKSVCFKKYDQFQEFWK